METKICNKCKRELPMNTDYFYKKHDTKDGFTNRCKECNGSIFTNKLVHIPKEGFKFCIKCDRELEINIKYFPPDKGCKDGLRNVCRECGSDGHFMNEGYIPKTWWSEEDNKLLIERYPNYTSEELIKLFYPNETMKSLSDKAYKLGCGWKTQEVKKRANEHKAQILSKLFKGKLVSEETRRKLSEIRKRQYATGELVSHWIGRTVSLEERQRSSERVKGLWSGDKNPRYNNPLYGESNGRWKGGIKNLYLDLRESISEWKKSSMQNCKYKCVITGLEFDEIHHLVPFRDIVDEVFINLNIDIKNTIGDYTLEDRKLIYEELIRLHNKYPLGVCLSKEIHKLFHDTYGYTNTNIEMFEEFKKRFYNGEFNKLLEEVS